MLQLLWPVLILVVIALCLLLYITYEKNKLIEDKEKDTDYGNKLKLYMLRHNPESTDRRFIKQYLDDIYGIDESSYCSDICNACRLSGFKRCSGLYGCSCPG